ncbi:hypothetical protein BSKO_11460 [Bryopsis sp. KO-2023]|nr:hypothetical protein BSKO_11460 [Bryopsis sp. KO-2023]
MEALPAGKQLNEGRYTIAREINRGATAVVYEAYDKTNDMQTALKVMNSQDGHMSVPLKIVKREVEYASSMRHDNIVRLLDVFAEGKQLILVWELIQGPDLLDLLNECGGRMPEDMTAFYFHQLLRGVVFMHANGFCHRDLKPENCMVSKETEHLKLIDFGLSKHLDSVNTLGVGTPDYMAPEMLGVVPTQASSGGPKYDASAVDVWAMGVMLYLLVTGVYPFEDPNHPNSLSHTLQNIRNGKIKQLPPKISQACGDLIRQLLEMHPTKRISLKKIAENKWLLTNAKSYANKVGRPDLFNPQMDGLSSDSVELEEVPEESAMPETNSDGKENRADGAVIDESEDAGDVGCFGEKQEKPSKGKWTSRLKRLFFGKS